VKIPGRKLVEASAHRAFKDAMDLEDRRVTLEQAAREAFGERAFTKPEIKSPAGIEELPLGKQFTATWAFKPSKGLTLAPDSDPRPEVSTTTKSLFTDVTKLPKTEVSAEPPLLRKRVRAPSDA
jgi:hypothetical protein